MKIVDRKTFLAMPPGTVFAKYAPCYFGELMIKGESWLHCNEFLHQSITDAVKCSGSDEFTERLDWAQETGGSIEMDFDCQGRDGCFDDDQLFAVFEQVDVEQLIARLKMALKGEKLNNADQRADTLQAQLDAAKNIADEMNCEEWCCTSVTKGTPDRCDVCRIQQALNAHETA